MATNDFTNLRPLITLGVIGLFEIITFAVAAASLGTLNKRLDAIVSKLLANSSWIVGYAVNRNDINIKSEPVTCHVYSCD